jgi:hypothetical protein
LPNGLHLEETLKLMGQSQITKLPEIWRVNGYLVIDHCTGLDTLSVANLNAQTGAIDVMLRSYCWARLTTLCWI